MGQRNQRGGGDVRARGGAAHRQGRGRGRGAPPSDEGWSEDPTPPVMHPFTAAPGLTVPVPTTPLGFVQLFLTWEVLEYLVAETSDYARYCRVELKKASSYKWRGCNLQDIAHYLGLQVFFGLCHVSNVRWYWRHNFFMSTPNVASLMTRDTYLSLDRFFHAFNRRAIPRGNTDCLIVVRPVLEYIRGRCKNLIVPSRNLSLDEGMMPYKGQLSIKVYNPKKPKKYGVKFFFVTESNTGYVIDFSVYSGVFSMLCDTVFGLVERFRNQGYHLFMDNYYNSVSLAQELFDGGIHVSGTLRLVRGAPAVLQQLGKNPQHMECGAIQWRHKGAVFVICWKGVRLVPMITTTHEPIVEDVRERRKTRRQGRVHYEEVTVQRPTVIGHCNRHMGGVDLFDQLVQYYPFTRRTRRWTHKLVKYLLQLATQNAYVLYCAYGEAERKLSHLQFMELVGNALVEFDDEEWHSRT